MIELYDSVALVEDLPDENLHRGQVGAVIEIHEPGIFEVEFSNRNNGITYAMLVLKGEQLMKLYYEPISRPEDAS